jgi:hypothetical protein
MPSPGWNKERRLMETVAKPAKPTHHFQWASRAFGRNLRVRVAAPAQIATGIQPKPRLSMPQVLALADSARIRTNAKPKTATLRAMSQESGPAVNIFLTDGVVPVGLVRRAERAI